MRGEGAVQEEMLHVPTVQLTWGERRTRIRGHRLLTVGTDVVRRLAGYAGREGTVGGQVTRPRRKNGENHRRRAVQVQGQVSGGPGRRRRQNRCERAAHIFRLLSGYMYSRCCQLSTD